MPKERRGGIPPKKPNSKKGPIQSSQFLESRSTGLLGFSAFATDDSSEQHDQFSEVNPELESYIRKLSKKSNVSKIKALQSIQSFINFNENRDQVVRLWPKVYCRLCLDSDQMVRGELVKTTKLLLSKCSFEELKKDDVIAYFYLSTGDPFVPVSEMAIQNIADNNLNNNVNNQVLVQLWTKVIELHKSDDLLCMPIGGLVNALKSVKSDRTLTDIDRVVDHPVYGELIKKSKDADVICSRLIDLTLLLARRSSLQGRILKAISGQLIGPRAVEWLNALFQLSIMQNIWSSIDFHTHIVPSLRQNLAHLLPQTQFLMTFLELLSRYCKETESGKLKLHEIITKIKDEIMVALRKDHTKYELGLIFLRWILNFEIYDISDLNENFLRDILFNSNVPFSSSMLHEHLSNVTSSARTQQNFIDLVEHILNDEDSETNGSHLSTIRALIESKLIEDDLLLKHHFSVYLSRKLSGKDRDKVAGVLAKWNSKSIWQSLNMTCEIENSSDQLVKVHTRIILFSKQPQEKIEEFMHSMQKSHPSIVEDVLILIKANRFPAINLAKIIDLNQMVNDYFEGKTNLIFDVLESCDPSSLAKITMILPQFSDQTKRFNKVLKMLEKLIYLSHEVAEEILGVVLKDLPQPCEFISLIINDCIKAQTKTSPCDILVLFRSFVKEFDPLLLDDLCRQLSSEDLKSLVYDHNIVELIPKAILKLMETIDTIEIFDVIRLLRIDRKYQNKCIQNIPDGFLVDLLSKFGEAFLEKVTPEDIDFYFSENPALFKHSCVSFRNKIEDVLQDKNAFILSKIVSKAGEQCLKEKDNCTDYLWHKLVSSVYPKFPQDPDPPKSTIFDQIMNLSRFGEGIVSPKEELSDWQLAINPDTLRIVRILNSYHRIRRIHERLLQEVIDYCTLYESFRLEFKSTLESDIDLLKETILLFNHIFSLGKKTITSTRSIDAALFLTQIALGSFANNTDVFIQSIELLTIVRDRAISNQEQLNVLLKCERIILNVFRGMCKSGQDTNSAILFICEYFRRIESDKFLGLLFDINTSGPIGEYNNHLEIMKTLLQYYTLNLNSLSISVLLARAMVSAAMLQNNKFEVTGEGNTARSVIPNDFIGALHSWNTVLLKSTSDQDFLNNSAGFLLLVHVIIIVYAKCSPNKLVIESISQNLHSNDFASKLIRALVGVLEDCTNIDRILDELKTREFSCDFVVLTLETEINLHSLEQLAACLLYDGFVNAPKLMREFAALMDGGRQKRAFFSLLFTHFTPAIISTQMNAINDLMQREANNSDDVLLKVLPSKQGRSIIAIIDIGKTDQYGDGKCIKDAALSSKACKIELNIKFPPNYPIEPFHVDYKSTAKSLANDVECRQWSLSLMKQGCDAGGMSLFRSLVQWKKNMRQKLEGVSECMICLYILDYRTDELPNIMCEVCKKKFHRHCLSTWFNNAPNTNCPHCRGEFFWP